MRSAFLPVLALTVSLVANPTQVSRSSSAVTAEGKFVVKIKPAKKKRFKPYERFVAANQLFDNEADWLNGMLRLPKNIPIVFMECGDINAFYNPATGEIQICYEMLEYANKQFADEDNAERAKSVIGATEFILYHEVGHALIDILDINTPGKEEDVVDALATYLLIGDGSDDSLQAALNAAVLFQSFGEGDMSDEHSFGEQRLYTILCQIYGSNPSEHADFVGEEGLPKERAVRCPNEYARMKRGWEALLAPYWKDEEQQAAR